MAARHEHTAAFRGAHFTGADLRGARLRECDLRQLKIVSSLLVDVEVSGTVENFVVNGVDVTGFVAAELDRRHPERVQVREMRTAEDHRAMWDTVERLWSDTLARAARLAEPARHERVDDEWSFVETLRHLVFATDLWAGHMVLDQPTPYHRLALPPTDYPEDDLAALEIDRDARPSYAEVLSVRADRMALVRGIVERLTADELDRTSGGQLPAAWEEPPPSVRQCLHVVMEEEIEHRRYAVRDLAVLET